MAETVASLSFAIAFDPEWQPGFTEVWDMRFATSIDLLPTDIPKMLDLERKTKEALAGSTTLIITHKPFILYSAQFYARLVKPLGRTVIAVDRAVEAAALLGIDVLPDLSGGLAPQHSVG